MFLPRKHRQNLIVPAKMYSSCQLCTHSPKQLISCRSLPLLFSRFFSFNRVLIKSSIAGNHEWLKQHFAKSPLAGVVPALVTAITILELAAGVLSGVGCLALIVLRDSTVAFYGAVISAVAIIALFFGQRMAKDYAGAAVLVPYFLVTLVAIYLLAQR